MIDAIKAEDFMDQVETMIKYGSLLEEKRKAAQATLPPVENEVKVKKDPIVEAVREDLLLRSQVGIKKYNTTLDRKDLSMSQWLQHAYEECLDQANYLKKCILEVKEWEKREKLLWGKDEVLY